MKKLILSAVVAAAAVFGAYTANQTSNEVAMNDLQVENIEALGEGDGSNGYKCPDSIQEYTKKDDSKRDRTINKGFDCMCKEITFHKITRRCN